MNEDTTQQVPPEEPTGPEEPTQQEEPTQPQAKRLLRSRSERMVGGVCSGLGKYFNVDPILFRIGAIALTLLGGAGLLLYVAMLLLVPSDGAGQGAPAPGEGRNRGLVIAAVVVLLLFTWPLILGGGLAVAGLAIPLAILAGIGLLVWWMVSGESPSSGGGRDIARRAALGTGVLLLLSVLAIGGAWAAGVGGETVVAVIVILAGVAVLAGAFARPVRWLILPAVVVALSAGTVAASGIDLDGGVGERDYRPSSAADLRDRYELGMGELRIDLRNADLPPGDTPLRVDLGLGEVRIVVPDDVCVATRATIGVGEVKVFDRTNEGIDLDYQNLPRAPARTSRLLLDADIGMGELDVRHDDGFNFGDDRFGPSQRGFGRNGDEDGPVSLASPENSACGTNG